MRPTTDELARFHRVDLADTESTLLCARRYAEETGREFTLVTADYQTAGRGQRGNSWESERGQNLLLALVARPAFLPAAAQFRLSQTVALAVADTVARYTDDVAVKWPNDVYVGDRKICGMLIEHDLAGPAIARSVTGIGLNVNQTVFRSSAPNPVSLRQLCGRPLDREEVLCALLRRFCRYYDGLAEACVGTSGNKYYDRKNKYYDRNSYRSTCKNGDYTCAADRFSRLDEAYAARLYRRRGEYAWRDAAGGFRAAIDHVGADGTLWLRDSAGGLRHYAFKEVEHII